MKRPYATQVDEEVAARARNAARALQIILGPEYTLSQLTTDALAEHVRRLEDDFNDGQPWTQRPRPLAPGRRISTS